ncbi:hypothetical protein BGZ94_006018, partial [Podila epigama]
LVELDALCLTVIVNNEVDFMTSVPRELGLTTQAQTLFKDQRKLDKEKTTDGDSVPESGHGHATKTVAFDFTNLCCGAHGLSILVTGIKDSVEHRVLFDTGPHSAIFLENARRLEIEFEKIEVIVLSHWHIDHSGGMLAAVEQCREARSRVQQQQQQHDQAPSTAQTKVILDLHPDRPDQRGACLKPPGPDISEPAEYVAWDPDPALDALESADGK